jgi:hypothetical protein
MLPSSSYDGQVYLYALANPDWFVEEGDAIIKLVFEALQTAPSNRHRVFISPDSAWVEYTALDELWTRRAPPSLPEQANALKAAEALLTQLEKKCSDANSAWPKGLRGMSLFPQVANLRRVSLEAVPRPDGSALDHWLYRAKPQLILDGGGKSRANVFGAQVEVRIGHMGQPISVRSRWQPLANERKLTTLSPYRAPEDDDADQQSVAPVINYLLEGEGIPQYYLAPYYFVYDGDNAEVSSASPFSLTVDLAQPIQDKTHTTLAALAQGGSGDYIYNWAYYSIAQVEEGMHELGRGTMLQVKGPDGVSSTVSSIDIDNGAYIVMLNVKDRKTGAFKHHQQEVYSNPLPAQEDAAKAPFLNT